MELALYLLFWIITGIGSTFILFPFSKYYNVCEDLTLSALIRGMIAGPVLLILVFIILCQQTIRVSNKIIILKTDKSLDISEKIN